MSNKYCNDVYSYSRYRTREVLIGDLGIGGDNPIRVQSMTTTDTMDTIATVEQSIRIIEAGGELVRITAPSINEAKNLENIKNELRKRGYKTPLAADIHFTPNAAETAARIVEKVRVNPGNYADKKKFQIINYTDELYSKELERIRDKFTPLVKICKEYGTAMRIGTNHGSLSDRIMSRYGDTPLGMVESALEFVRICEENGFQSIVLSMKSSNPQVMVQAYRLLINKMEEENMNYPLHLGVTEAGDGEDGRIKSAVGIGTLLEDGIGDTIRVSLTEEPEYEIPVCLRLVNRYTTRARHGIVLTPSEVNPIDPFHYKKRHISDVEISKGHYVPPVIISFDKKDVTIDSFDDIGYHYSSELDKWSIDDIAADYIYLGKKDVDIPLPGTLRKIFDYEYWTSSKLKFDSYPLLDVIELLETSDRSDEINFVELRLSDLTGRIIDKLKKEKNLTLILTSETEIAMAEMRRAFIEFINDGITFPVIIKREFGIISSEDFTIFSSTDVGGLLIDGLGDGIWLNAENIETKQINTNSFGILQAARVRISKTEYISCPSCGRTLFDLQETTARIRSVTNHLKGLKIAIMGCIVNGPGEMADADYGYVGSGPGKITLYKEKDVIKRGVDADTAVDELISLIKQNGDWVEKEL
ncbi:4-hydroxy-3-methylbut-2-en-1-yl diphosphate synthase [soil metagenome]